MTRSPVLRLTGYAAAGVLLVGGAAQASASDLEYRHLATDLVASQTVPPAAGTAMLLVKSCTACGGSGNCSEPDCRGVVSIEPCDGCHNDISGLNSGACSSCENG